MGMASLRSEAVETLASISFLNGVMGLGSLCLFVAKNGNAAVAGAKLEEITKACGKMGKKVISLSQAIDGEVSCDVAKWVWEHNQSNAIFSRNMFFGLFLASLGTGFYSFAKQDTIQKIGDDHESAV